MNRLAAAVLLFLSVTPRVHADEPPEAEVMRVVLAEAIRVLRPEQAPAVIAHVSRPGAERFAKEFVHEIRGTVIADELAASYEERNGTVIELDLGERFKVADLTAYDTGQGFDWAALEKEFPGVKSVLVASRPAFDGLHSYALMRVDVFTRDRATTRVSNVERDAKGKWRVGITAVGGRESMHR